MTEPQTDPQTSPSIAVIGGGISGLAAAHRIVTQNDAAQVTLFESSDRFGGIIRTETIDDFLVEFGPDSFITNKPGAIQLCEELGIADELIPTDETFRRSLVLSRGKPQPVPDGFMLMAPSKPWSIMTTPILSLGGRLRLLKEAFVPRRQNESDESLASFVRRRFGNETLDRLVQPLVGGIYTSDPEKLSLSATMPRFLEMERTAGSVIRATLRNKKTSNGQDSSGSGARYGLFASHRDGLSAMINSIVDSLKVSGRADLRLNSPVQSVSRRDSSASKNWWVNLLEGNSVETFDAVILTLPAYQTASLLSGPEFSDLNCHLKSIEYASSAILISAHRLEDFEHSLDAFGMVVPAIENRDILAVSFSSRKFTCRAPDGQILLRTFVGGAMQPELLKRNDDEIIEMVYKELQSMLGMKGTPLFSRLARYNNAMPQYHIGHLDKVTRIESQVDQFAGLALAGSAYRGVGIPDSIASAFSASEKALNDLATSTG